jgi:hypothetical protein
MCIIQCCFANGKESLLVDGAGLKAALHDVPEISLPQNGVTSGVRICFLRDGLPIQAVPLRSYLVIPPA